MDVTYTMFRAGKPARKHDTGVAVFDLDSDGTLLGARMSGDADWVSELLKLVMAGKLRIDLEG